MKKKSVNFIIPLVVYPFDILISIAEDDASFQKTIRRHLPPDCIKDLEDDPGILKLRPAENARTINFETGYQTVIRFKTYPRTVRDFGIVSHEIFHACSFILWRMGIHLEIQKTDEVYAYLIDYVTTEFYNNVP